MTLLCFPVYLKSPFEYLPRRFATVRRQLSDPPDHLLVLQVTGKGLWEQRGLGTGDMGPSEKKGQKVTLLMEPYHPPTGTLGALGLGMVS